MNKDQLRFAVRDGREELGMTQAALAEQAGVGRQWIVGLESGRMANPKWQSVSAVLDVLGLELIVRPKPSRQSAPDPMLSAVLDRVRVDPTPVVRVDG